MIKEKETKTENQCCHDVLAKNKHHHRNCHCGQNSAIYGLGVIGALFYFLQNAATFTAVIVSIFKSIFWPAFVLFKVLSLLQI